MSHRFIFALGAALVGGMVLQSSAAPTAPPGFLTQFEWRIDDPLFGGLSAIDISADGRDVVVVTDRGAFAAGQILRDAGGLITDIRFAPFALLRGKEQAPLAKGRTDSEGLAIAPDGSAYISFEGPARVLYYANLEGSAENLPDHPDFAKMQPNSALEALAIDAEGTLYTLPERSGAADRPFPIYRYKNGVWDQKLSLPREDGYLPVGADFGPDGRLYILLRNFHGIQGFSSKLVRMTVNGDAIGPVQVLLQTPVGFHDNLEGVSIWRDAQGRLRASMVADNNFLPFLSSGIVEYTLPD